jgi:hypothetical protein
VSGKIESLPKWAQDEIAMLRRNCAEFERMLKVAGGEVETRIYSNPHQLPGDMPRRFIDSTDTVRFEAKSGGLDVSIFSGEMEISSYTDGLCVLPISSNRIMVKVAK